MWHSIWQLNLIAGVLGAVFLIGYALKFKEGSERIAFLVSSIFVATFSFLIFLNVIVYGYFIFYFSYKAVLWFIGKLNNYFHCMWWTLYLTRDFKNHLNR